MTIVTMILVVMMIEMEIVTDEIDMHCDELCPIFATVVALSVRVPIIAAFG